MIKGRRVGTFTTGIVLVILGGIFLLKLIYPNINYLKIASLWPAILVLFYIITHIDLLRNIL